MTNGSHGSTSDVSGTSSEDGRAARCPGVLVVDDDEAVRTTIAEVLRESGYEVHCASNGKQAMESLGSLPHPCVMLLDLMMPVMSGWEVLEALHDDAQLDRIPVVVVSAMTASGVKACLHKPIELELLLDTVGRYCGAATAH
jgi:two-component system response regulator CpxR